MRSFVAIVVGHALGAALAAGEERTLQVRADQRWTSTGIYVRAGERIEFRADGRVSWGSGRGGPEGGSGGGGYFRPLDEAPVGALIGSVGQQFFFIGERASVRSPDDGELRLGINDDKFSDNEGFFRVEVQTGGRGGSGSSWWDDEPSYGRPTRPPSGRPSYGGNYESFWWRGRVDGSDHLIVQGQSLRVKHEDKLPIQSQDYKFSSALPRQEVDVGLNVIRARGRVEVVERPSRRNDYTAVILVDDSDDNGAFDYELELFWEKPRHSSGGGNERAFDGVFRFRGRVDKGVSVEIQGRTSRLVDDAGGDGSSAQSANFTEALPSKDVVVSLRKIRGRGRVSLVQSPERSNGYTAIVRIEDDSSGAETYEFELGWN